MKRYLQFALESQEGAVVVEVQEADEGGYERAARAPELAVKAGQTFEAALDKVRPIAQAVVAKVQGLGGGLAEVMVEFGLKMDAHAGIVVAAGGVEANFKVSLKWARAHAREGDAPRTA
jgi:hypothetical protein